VATKTPQFDAATMNRALVRRAAGVPRSRRGRTIPTTPGSTVNTPKNMPSGRAIANPGAPGAATRPMPGANPITGVRTMPGSPGSNMRPSKAMQGGQQLQAVARRAINRRNGGGRYASGAPTMTRRTTRTR